MKYLFIDMDGVLASFDNYQGKVVTPPEDFTEDFFATREPVWELIDNIQRVFPEGEYEYHILSHSPNEESTKGKNQFLDDNFYIKPENRHFVQWSKYNIFPKSKEIVDFIFENDIEIKDIYFIDDDIMNLVDVETLGATCYHPSKVLTLGRKKPIYY